MHVRFSKLSSFVLRHLIVTVGGKDKHEKIRTKEWDDPHFIYTLSPAIIPSKEIKTGNIYPNGRVWCHLDTLLTCDTISEARELTKK